MTSTTKRNRIFGFASVVIVLIFFLKCSSNKADTLFNKYVDTTVSVYGPYKVLKLPVSRGVKILNPIQVALGPGGKIFAANQSGEVYTLEDSDGDGIEDEAVLYC
ncbi:MAG TPA: hypothetical protein VEV87_04485, partial [Chitinophagaceae bacterium]|nr:hypothetical protein [Chitinophagaceae bacterium]